jgi:hypothetical protein
VHCWMLLLPAGEDGVDGGQLSHRELLFAPVTVPNRPAGHRVQLLLSSVSAYDPRGQVGHTAAPEAPLAEPGTQGWQASPFRPPPSEGFAVPGGHSKHEEVS